MLTVVLVVALTAAAAAVAGWINRARRPDAPSTPRFATPQQLDRGDFEHPDRPWLLALFSSSTCSSCHEARDLLDLLRDDRIADLHVQDVVFPDARDLHERYAIDGVPALVLADAEGVVSWSFVGVPPAQALADLLVDAGLSGRDDGTAVDL